MPKFSKLEDSPAFKSLAAEEKEKQVEINEFLEKLDPYSLFRYAQAKCINLCGEKKENIHEVAKRLSIQAEEVVSIYSSGRALTGMIVHRKST
jgi:hypothetical protein